ncbi:hypothetical protein [Streptomyces sp. NPDC059575]
MTEAVGVVLDDLGTVLVDGAGQVAGVGVVAEVDAGRGGRTGAGAGR